MRPYNRDDFKGDLINTLLLRPVYRKPKKTEPSASSEFVIGREIYRVLDELADESLEGHGYVAVGVSTFDLANRLAEVVMNTGLIKER